MSRCWMHGTEHCPHAPIPDTPENRARWEAGLTELESAINEYERNQWLADRPWIAITVQRLRAAYALLRPHPSGDPLSGDVHDQGKGLGVGEPGPRWGRFRR